MNFKHLYYFWVAAHAGGILRAGEQLHTTPQTLSGQIKLLEDRLGRRLFQKRGRQIELTDAGRVAIGYADEIFALGGELEQAMQQPAGGQPVLDFRVGVADSVPKSIACHLLEPVWGLPRPVRLICQEGRLRDLLASLAVHRLDLVIADEPLPRQLSVKAFDHVLGSSGLSFFAQTALKASLPDGFPACLNGAPLLLQGSASPVRPRLDEWLASRGLRPRIVGEFDDGALMTAFGQAGRGVFASPTVLEAETAVRYGVELLGRSPELVVDFYAISTERRITHPCVAAITSQARGRLFGGGPPVA